MKRCVVRLTDRTLPGPAYGFLQVPFDVAYAAPGIMAKMRHYAANLVTGSGIAGTVSVYGHYGRPVLVFPTEGGGAWEWADNGMVGAVRT